MQLKDLIADVLSDGSVLSSTQLIEALEKTGMSRDAAKQAISRCSRNGNIWRSRSVRLPGGGHLFASRKSFGSGNFNSKLAEALGNLRPGLTRCLNAIAKRTAINRVEAMRLLAVGDESLKKRMFLKETEALVELGISRIREGGVLESFMLRDSSEDYDNVAIQGITRLRNSVVASDIILDRFRRNAVISWNAFERASLSDLVVRMNGQIFSSIGYSFLTPLVRFRDNKAVGCPVLIDCHWNNIFLWDVEGFLERIKRATHRGKKQQLYLGVIAGLDFADDAFSKARRSGLIVINMQQDFGAEAKTAIEALQSMMSEVNSETADVGSSLDNMSEILDELHENPIVVEIRSLGFEIACGLILRANGCESVELGCNVPFNSTTRDVDGYGVRGSELRVVEAKAHHGGHSLDAADVRKFFTETVPSLKKYLRLNRIEFDTCKAQIWTTGPKGQRAQDELDAVMKSRPKRDEWGIVAGEKLLDEIPPKIRSRVKKLIKSLQIQGRGIGANKRKGDITVQLLDE